MGRTLYQFPTSPFSRRARLALARKNIAVDLVDAREDPKALEHARKLWPLRTMPVFVDGDRVIGDSTAITHYLDAIVPEPPLWDRPHISFAAAALVDGFLNTVVDVGTRYFALSGDPAWNPVKTEMLGRANDAAAKLATMTRDLDGWSAPEIWLYTMVSWFDALPTRVNPTQNVKQIVSLGVTLPEELRAWAQTHKGRDA